MTTAKEIVAHYIGEYREGRFDNAFYGLIDLNPELIPELIEAYDSSDDPELKVFVIRSFQNSGRSPRFVSFVRPFAVMKFLSGSVL